MNVLVVAPHPDDEAIGCGGSICLRAARGDRVVVVFLTSGELGLKHLPREQAHRVRESEAQAAAEVLGIAELAFLRQPDWFVGDAIEETATLMRQVVEREMPQQIYLPHAGEWHPDHQASEFIVRRALASADRPPPTLLAYEVWTPLVKYDQVEDITSTMARKLYGIRCYSSQLTHFRYDRAVRGLNEYRGHLAARCRYAEVFQHASLDVSGCQLRMN
jgi:LmbE family N-acetylglucosaminyl deacetylase